MNYKVVEKFVSVNGEGNLAGQLAVFIRFAGCNLNCTYCDTMWANVEDVKFMCMTENDIYDYIKTTNVKNVTITGGEPLLQEGIFELLELLSKDEELNVEIETNGSIDISRFKEIKGKVPKFTLDYKLGTSGMENRMRLENYKYLSIGDSVKFVAGSLEDIEKTREIVNKYDLTSKCSVHLSQSYGQIDLVQIVDFMINNNMNGVKLSPQLHKIIWDPNVRGV
jgi:7-carboxy-7-deazaguanine synthase